MCLCPLQLSCIYPFSRMLSALEFACTQPQNSNFKTSLSGSATEWLKLAMCWIRTGTLGKYCCSTTAQTSASYVSSVRHQLELKKRYPYPSVDFSWSSSDSSKSDCLWDYVQHWDYRGALLWLDIPIDSGTRAFGQRHISFIFHQ